MKAVKKDDKIFDDDFVEVFDAQAVLHARKKMPSEKTMTELSDFFKNFGDSTRLKIVSALMAGELCVAEIAEVLGMSVSAISHQLRVLRHAKIVRSRRDGKMVYYAIDDNHVGIVYSVGMDHIQEEKGE
ncbi:MAG: transcriptional regulator [Treponema sp.]|nr:MAG: transcriptional regulator [Treponema sp.]